jgi:hypothetical protein
LRDIDVRSALLSQELSRYSDDPDTRIVPELGIFQGASRVDVAVVNGYLHAYEIKSERDTLSRLPAQAEAYGQVFDSVTIVAATAHLERVRKIIPAWWGILEARTKSGGVQLRRRRKERRNPHINLLAVAQLLWKDEALALLESEGDARGLRSKPRQVIWEALVLQLSADTLRARVRDVLKAREGWRSE